LINRLAISALERPGERHVRMFVTLSTLAARTTARLVREYELSERGQFIRSAAGRGMPVSQK
jgi:hypothetical protein